MFNRIFRMPKQFHSSSQSPKLDVKGEKEGKKRNNKHVYSKERKKQRKHLNKEIAGVNKLLKEGAISKDIHSRYLKMLEMGYAQKIQETRDRYGFTNLKHTPTKK
jgi:hypothetical protein